MPCRAMLEVQPVLEDLAAAAAAPPSSSSSDGGSDCEQETAAVLAGTLPDAQHASIGCSQDAAGVGVHITQDAGSSSSCWRRILVHLTGQQRCDNTSSSCNSSADDQAAQAVAAAEQMAALCRSASGAASVCSLRCWHAVAGADGSSQSSAKWQAALVSRLQEGTGQQQMALQSVQVCAVATSMQPGPCWAVIEAYVEP
jgi:hypothetical protein